MFTDTRCSLNFELMIQKVMLISIPFYSQIETKRVLKEHEQRNNEGSKNKTDIQDYSYPAINQSSLPLTLVV